MSPSLSAAPLPVDVLVDRGAVEPQAMAVQVQDPAAHLDAAHPDVQRVVLLDAAAGEHLDLRPGTAPDSDGDHSAGRPRTGTRKLTWLEAPEASLAAAAG